MDLDLAVPLSTKLVMKHLRSPPLETVIDDLPGRNERDDELSRTARMRQVVFPAIPVGIGKGSAIGSTLLEDRAQPVDACSGHVRRGGPDRPEGRCRRKLELFGG